MALTNNQMSKVREDILSIIQSENAVSPEYVFEKLQLRYTEVTLADVGNVLEGICSAQRDCKYGSRMVAVLLMLLTGASMSMAQTQKTPDPAKWMCRDMANSGNFIYEGETVFGDRACRPIPQATPPVVTPTVSQPPVAAQPVATSVLITPVVRHDRPFLFISSTAPEKTARTGLFGGATTWSDDQTAEIIKDFEGCNVVPSLKADGADYTFTLNRLGNNFNRVVVSRAD